MMAPLQLRYWIFRISDFGLRLRVVVAVRTESFGPAFAK